MEKGRSSRKRRREREELREGKGAREKERRPSEGRNMKKKIIIIKENNRNSGPWDMRA